MALTPELRWEQIVQAKKNAPKDRLLFFGMLIFFGCCLVSWFTLDLGLTHPVTGESRFQIQSQFVNDVIPFPLRQQNVDGTVSMNWDTSIFISWVSESVAEIGWKGIFDTIAISVLAIMIAALIAIFLVIPASRNVALKRGFLPADEERNSILRALRYLLFVVVRGLLVVLRAIPEFIWAFLLLIVLGPVAIAGILALALHNAGILAKLTSESVEDLDAKPLEALAGVGGSKATVALMGVTPRAFRQFLVYFFYRWETCIRETAILGILAIHTLGLHVDHAFAYFHYDKAILFILINSMIVIGGDFLGSLARRSIRNV